MTKTRGRPKLPDNLKRARRVVLVMTDEEHARLAQAAAREGLTVSAFIRWRAAKVRA